LEKEVENIIISYENHPAQGSWQKYVITKVMDKSIGLNLISNKEIENHIKINDLRETAEPVSFSPELLKSLEHLFKTIQSLNTAGDYYLARDLCDYVFGQFNILPMLEKQLDPPERRVTLAKLIKTINEYEKLNAVQLHKGTPFMFLGSYYLFQEAYNKAFSFFSACIEEDKRFSTQVGIPQLYKKSPSYKTISLSEEKDNFLAFYLHTYVIVQLNFKLDKYNLLFPNNQINYSELKTKFLESDSIEHVKLAFSQQVMEMYSTGKDIPDNNDFMTIRNVGMLLKFCLIIEETLKTTSQFSTCRFISNCAMQAITQRPYDKPTEDIFRLIGFESNFDAAVQTCITEITQNHSINHLWYLVWGVRNYSAHNLKNNKILVNKFIEITDCLFYLLFYVSARFL